jgi:dihydropteroate synthase
VLMHSRGTPKDMQQLPPMENALNEVIAGLRESIARAERSGVTRENIAIDPGIGFGKTVEQNLELIVGLDQLTHEFPDLPVLIGTSRKSFLGKLLNGAPADERVYGTIATIVAAVLNGAHIVRVHDVKSAAEAIKIADAIRNVS